LVMTSFWLKINNFSNKEERISTKRWPLTPNRSIRRGSESGLDGIFKFSIKTLLLFARHREIYCSASVHNLVNEQKIPHKMYPGTSA
jgi:hypothetical protein